jgi:PhnB protein
MPERSLPNRSLTDQLDRAIQAMLEQSERQVARRREDYDPTVTALLGVARDLRDLPRQDFKVRLKTNLERSSQMENAAKQAISPDAAKHADTMPSGFHTIAPYIIVPRASEFIEFLKNAFDGTERFRVGRDPSSELIMHAEVQIGNSIIELADAYEPIPAAPTAIHLYVDDAHSSFKQAIDAGATSIYQVGEHVSGDIQGAVRDPFGNLWYIAMKGDWTPRPGELVPSVQPYLHLRGSEKMIPFLESAFGGVVQGHVPRSPEGHVLHATVQIGDNTLEIDEAHGEFQPMPCHLHLHIDDADAMYARALRAGATSIDPPSNKPYGRSGGVKDPFGNSWYLTSPLPAQS